eukprot:3258706-Alexandrium_andersonii.AAC.2
MKTEVRRSRGNQGLRAPMSKARAWHWEGGSDAYAGRACAIKTRWREQCMLMAATVAFEASMTMASTKATLIGLCTRQWQQHSKRRECAPVAN